MATPQPILRFLLGALVLSGASGRAQEPEGVVSWVATEAELVSRDPAQDDYFGFNVAVSGDTAVVGAWGADHSHNLDAGAAYVFVRVGESWVLQQKLVASEPTYAFGGAVAISGDTIVIGVWNVGIYVFQREGSHWNEQAKIVSPDPNADYFADSVAVSGDTILVGAPRFMQAGLNDMGAAYVFVRTGAAWSFQARLLHSDPESFDWFGQSVAVSGDTALIGAVGDSLVNGSNDDEGSATVFVRSAGVWTEEQRLSGGAQSDGDQFGQSVAVWGDMALVGSPLDNNSGGSNAGSAHVFVRSGMTWSKQQVLLPSGLAGNDNFGESVGLSGNLALVGADADDHVNGSSGNEGSAYVFANDGSSWSEVVHLTASNAASGDQFGQSVAISGDTAVVGAPFGDNAGAPDAGAAYAFRIQPPHPVSYCTAGTSASGCQALLSAAGTASATAPSGFVVSASTVEGQKDGLFFFGTNGQQASPWGNGTSYQCVVPPVVRTPTTSGVGTIGQCDGSFALDLNALWCPTCPKPAKNPGAAAVVQAQLWYRDPLSTSNQTTSLSDAIEFVVEL